MGSTSAVISMAEFEATSAALSMAASEAKARAAAPVVAMADVRRADPGADLQRVSQQRLAAVAAPCRLAAAAHWRPWRLAAVAVRSFAARGGGSGSLEAKRSKKHSLRNLRRSAACVARARSYPRRSAALGKLRKGTYDRCRRRTSGWGWPEVGGQGRDARS